MHGSTRYSRSCSGIEVLVGVQLTAWASERLVIVLQCMDQGFVKYEIEDSVTF